MHQQGYQGTAGGTGAWNSPQTVRRLYRAVDQSDADLQKVIETANSQAKGKAIGAAFVVAPQSSTGAAGESSAISSSQDVQAHVYVVADKQLKDVIVDAKSNKVISTETRQMVSSPWSYREGRDSTGKRDTESERC